MDLDQMKMDMYGLFGFFEVGATWLAAVMWRQNSMATA